MKRIIILFIVFAFFTSCQNAEDDTGNKLSDITIDKQETIRFVSYVFHTSDLNQVTQLMDSLKISNDKVKSMGVVTIGTGIGAYDAYNIIVTK